MSDYSEILDAAFPAATYSNTIRAIREGVAAGDEAITGIPLLATPVGRDLRGLARRAGVMNRLHELCEAGDLPFVAEFLPMPIGSWHWLELRSGICHGYLIKTGERSEFPKDTPTQQDKRATNQADLFDDPKIVRLSEPNVLTAWLCYGATKNGATSHALWGVPSGSQAEIWLARRDILNAVRTSLPAAAQTKPAVDPRSVIKLRDGVIDKLGKNGKGQAGGEE